MGIVTVGREAVVEQPAAPLDHFDGFQSLVDPDHTNLESGLDLAASILPAGFRRRIILVSDGQQNIGDAVASAGLLHQQGIRVDVLPERVKSGPEVLVDRVDGPAQLHVQERFPVTVWINSNVVSAARLDVFADQRLVQSRSLRLPVGESHVTLYESPLAPGPHRLQIHLTPAKDTQPQNNSGSLFTIVQGAPKVLVIAQNRTEAGDVLSSLRSTGLQTVLRAPKEVPPSLPYLQTYGAIVLVDTPAPSLGTDLMNQLVPYVRDLGRGLVVIGGQEAYGVGGYGQTPLEKILPVKMDLPQRRDTPSAGVVLIIESLEANMPVNISKEAGKGVIRLLTEQDQVGIIDTPNDGGAGWVVPLQNVRDKTTILHDADIMLPGDPGSYAPYLQAAYASLRTASVKVKHIILLGDGDAQDPSYHSVLKQIRAGGVTVSVIATNVGSPGDVKTMQNIARWGGGRFYRADDVNSIPRIFLREATTVARSGIVQGKFYPQKLSSNPMVRDLSRIPPLYGYVATAPKATGELVLVSKNLDPVLAGWQYGLGRAVAWTSDASGLWTHDWLAAPEENRFWADVVNWTLPASTGQRMFVAATQAGGQEIVSVQVPAQLGLSATVRARIVSPALQGSNVSLDPTAPGQFRGAFQVGSAGSYGITVEARGNGHADVVQTGADVPYSPEYRAIGTNTAVLRQVAKVGGGSLFTQPGDAWRTNLAGVSGQKDLTTLLWILALLLLPIDVATRRLLLGRRDLLALRRAVGLSDAPSIGDQPLSPAAPRRHVPATARTDYSPRPLRRETEPGSGNVPSTIDQLLAAKRRRQ
ncbi:MAG TPA: VWA domain-containing protein, partial [Chloroflexota bacterium]